jgi:hypothetical protein
MMNTIQRAYIKAKAFHEAAQVMVNRLETTFLADHGRSEKHIWGIIDDDTVFEQLNNEFSEIHKSEEAVLVKARMDLRQSEDALIAYGLSIVPKKYADILHSSKDIMVRQKIIDLIMTFDIRTVPKCIA